jgi:hypothetical protein
LLWQSRSPERFLFLEARDEEGDGTATVSEPNGKEAAPCVDEVGMGGSFRSRAAPLWASLC